MLVSFKGNEFFVRRESFCCVCFSFFYRDGIYFEEGFGLGIGVGVEAVGDLVEVVNGVGLDSYDFSV